MASIINLNTFSDKRGDLTVVEKIIPFDIKRIYYIYNVEDKNIVRAGHRHKKTIQALICLNGSCEIYSDNSIKKETFTLKSPSECLILNPEDWHTMTNFSKDSVLLVLASEFYDINDYIDTPYL